MTQEHMKISIKTNCPVMRAAMQKAESQVPYALQQALNKTVPEAVGALHDAGLSMSLAPAEKIVVSPSHCANLELREFIKDRKVALVNWLQAVNDLPQVWQLVTDSVSTPQATYTLRP